MKTLHKRCAGLDVHKVEVLACLRLISKRKVEREVRRFRRRPVSRNIWIPLALDRTRRRLERTSDLRVL